MVRFSFAFTVSSSPLRVLESLFVRRRWPSHVGVLGGESVWTLQPVYSQNFPFVWSRQGGTRSLGPQLLCHMFVRASPEQPSGLSFVPCRRRHPPFLSVPVPHLQFETCWMKSEDCRFCLYQKSYFIRNRKRSMENIHNVLSRVFIQVDWRYEFHIDELHRRLSTCIFLFHFLVHFCVPYAMRSPIRIFANEELGILTENDFVTVCESHFIDNCQISEFSEIFIRQQVSNLHVLEFDDCTIGRAFSAPLFQEREDFASRWQVNHFFDSLLSVVVCRSCINREDCIQRIWITGFERQRKSTSQSGSRGMTTNLVGCGAEIQKHEFQADNWSSLKKKIFRRAHQGDERRRQ